MKILNQKETKCTTMKVFYETNENYYDDIKQKKKEGWKVVTKPNWYDERMNIVMKTAQNGTVLTYIRYDELGYSN